MTWAGTWRGNLRWKESISNHESGRKETTELLLSWTLLNPGWPSGQQKESVCLLCRSQVSKWVNLKEILHRHSIFVTLS